MMTRIGRERGWPPRGRDDFEREAGPDGAMYVGSPETVAAKILRTVKDLGLARFDLKYSNGTLPHELAMKSIELYGTKVARWCVHRSLTLRPMFHRKGATTQSLFNTILAS